MTFIIVLLILLIKSWLRVTAQRERAPRTCHLPPGLRACSGQGAWCRTPRGRRQEQFSPRHCPRSACFFLERASPLESPLRAAALAPSSGHHWAWNGHSDISC